MFLIMDALSTELLGRLLWWRIGEGMTRTTKSLFLNSTRIGRHTTGTILGVMGVVKPYYVPHILSLKRHALTVAGFRLTPAADLGKL